MHGFLFTVPSQQNYIRNKQSIRTIPTRIYMFNCTRKKQRVTVPICKREMHGVSIINFVTMEIVNNCKNRACGACNITITVQFYQWATLFPSVSLLNISFPHQNEFEVTNYMVLKWFLYFFSIFTATFFSNG